MTADIKNLVHQLHQSGLNLELKADGKLAVSPSNCLNEALRGLIRGNRDALVSWLETQLEPPEPPTDIRDWRELASAYHAHHFRCMTCIAAGKGTRYGLRCGTGTALWAAYEDSTVDTPKFTKVHKEFTKSTTSPQKSTPQDGDKSAIVNNKSAKKDTPK